MTVSPIILGQAGDTRLELTLERLVGSHACIIANSGGGKSGLLRKVLEQTHGRVQHIVLDVEDEFYTLRERFDYVIAGGDGGDLPIAIDTAGSLATAALEHGFSLIVQLNDLGTDAPEYVSAFIEGLMRAPRDLWHPVLVVVDELQRFASKDAGEATPAIKDLLFRGRKRGFTGLFASLRMAEIDPGIRGMVNNWLLGRVGQALDRRTMAEQLGFSAAEARNKLANMAERHFWAMGPALAAEPTLFKVADVETTPVHAGQAKVATPPPPEALRAILAGLAVAPAPEVPDMRAHIDARMGTPENAEMTALRRRVAELERERDEWTIERGVGQRQLNALTTENRALRDIIAGAWADVQRIKTAHEFLADTEVPPAAEANEGDRHEVAQDTPQPVGEGRRQRDSRRPSTDEGIPPRWQRILDAIAWAHRLLKSEAVERNIVAWFAGCSPKSSGYQNDLGAMRTRGLICYPGSGLLALDDEGKALANWPTTPPTKQALLDAIKANLEPRFCRILDALWSTKFPIGREPLAEAIGVSASSSGFQNDLGKLRTLGLVDYPQSGMVGLGKVLQ